MYYLCNFKIFKESSTKKIKQKYFFKKCAVVAKKHPLKISGPNPWNPQTLIPYLEKGSL